MTLPSKGYLYGRLYQLRGTPHLRLAGVRADLDDLYDGSFFSATTSWWNGYLERRPALERFGSLLRYDNETEWQLSYSPNPENRPILTALGATHAPGNERLGAAAIGLAYALARTLNSGPNYEANREQSFAVGGSVTPELFDELSHRYGLLADDYDLIESPGWWAEREQSWVSFACVIPAIRWAFSDQVKRWEQAEGRKLGKVFGLGIEEGLGMIEFRDRLFELGGRFYEAEKTALERAA